MWFKHSMSIAQQLIPIYNTTVYKNNVMIALNVTACAITWRHQQAVMADLSNV